MVSDHISVVDAGSGHDFVVFRVDGMIPSDYVAEADSECVVSVHSLDEFSDVVRMLLEVRKLVPFADLRVSDDDDVVVCIVLRVLLDNEIIFLYLRIDLLVEQCLTFQCCRYVTGWSRDEYKAAVRVCIQSELSLCVGLDCVQSV